MKNIINDIALIKDYFEAEKVQVTRDILTSLGAKLETLPTEIVIIILSSDQKIKFSYEQLRSLDNSIIMFSDSMPDNQVMWANPEALGLKSTECFV